MAFESSDTEVPMRPFMAFMVASNPHQNQAESYLGEFCQVCR